MTKTERGFFLIGLPVLTLILLISCSKVPEDVVGNRVIAINVGDSTMPRFIGAEEVSVTDLYVEIFRPDGEFLGNIHWKPYEKVQTYYLQARELGVHEIVVTHVEEVQGIPVEAVESAFFTNTPTLITEIDINPGEIGIIKISDGEYAPPICTMFGTWINVVSYPEPKYVDEYGRCLSEAFSS
jgi:hypothetical protein